MERLGGVNSGICDSNRHSIQTQNTMEDNGSASSTSFSLLDVPRRAWTRGIVMGLQFLPMPLATHTQSTP